MSEPNGTAGIENTGKEERTGGVYTPWWVVVIAGVAIVILAFVAALLGAKAGQPEYSSAEEPSEIVIDEDYTILPAGADVRVGSGVPDVSLGEVGDAYIDKKTWDVYLRTEDGWVRAGNVREEARDNLTGAQGEPGEAGEQGERGERGKAGESGSQGTQGSQGPQGKQGERGAPGAPGADGTQVLLGTESPKGKCTSDDVFIDTVALTFYRCEGDSWKKVTD